jgi:hypothetical protein
MPDMTTTFSISGLRRYLVNTKWRGYGMDEHVFYTPPTTSVEVPATIGITLPLSDDAAADDKNLAEYQRNALQALSKFEHRPIDELMRDIWPETMKRSHQGESFGPHGCLCWERYDEDRYPSESYLFFEVVTHRSSGKIVAQIERFRGGSELTYAQAAGERLGGFRTVAAAVHAVERKLETFDPKQVLS